MAKQKNNKLIWILLGLVLILVVFAMIKSRSQEKGEKVSVEKVERRSISETVAASGKIFPETEVKISSDASGEIVELFVEEGDSVVSGQLLAKVDPDVYQSAVERSQASVNNSKAQAANAKAGIERSRAQKASAKAEIERIKAQMTNTKAIHKRNAGLHKDGIISDADFEQSLSNVQTLEANLLAAKANYDSADASLESARQTHKASEYAVKSSEASLKEMNANLRKTTIYAPQSGIVSSLSVEQGERVVGTAQMAGTEMMRIANLHAMEVQVDVSENDVLRVALNDKVEIEVDAYIGRKFNGVVTQIANSASSISSALTTDQVTNFVVKISVDANSYKDLISKNNRYPFRPGMSASVEILTHTEADILSIPIQAVTTREEKDNKKGKAKKVSNKNDDDEVKEVVFVAMADTVKMVEVKTGIQDDSYIQILSGLEEDEAVVTAPYSAVSKKLKAGADIEIVEEDDLYKKKD